MSAGNHDHGRVNDKEERRFGGRVWLDKGIGKGHKKRKRIHDGYESGWLDKGNGKGKGKERQRQRKARTKIKAKAKAKAKKRRMNDGYKFGYSRRCNDKGKGKSKKSMHIAKQQKELKDQKINYIERTF